MAMDERMARTAGAQGGVLTRTPMRVARTLLSLGAVLPASVVLAAVQDALIAKLVSEVELVCLLERLGGPGRRGE